MEQYDNFLRNSATAMEARKRRVSREQEVADEREMEYYKVDLL